MGNHDRIIHKLNTIFKLEGTVFIRELYRQILNREPDHAGLRHHDDLLLGGMSKQNIAIEMMQSGEAEKLYNQQFQNPADYNRNTIAGIFKQFFIAHSLYFIHALYNELLCRNPKIDEINILLQYLEIGAPRINLIGNILLSNECLNLSASPHAPIDSVYSSDHSSSNNKHVKHIGLFVGYPQKVSFEGEGIGRFVARLTEGLLSNHDDVIISVATTEWNYEEFKRLLIKQMTLFPDRIFLHQSYCIEWINQNVPADVWIVPSVSLESALFLQKPIILCLHDLVYLHFKEMYFEIYPDLCYQINRVVYALAEKASAVVFNSNYIRNNEGLNFLRLPIEKTHVVRLAPPVEEYGSFGVQDEHAFRQKYNLHNEYIVFPSVIRLHKNHHRLIDAFLKFRQSSIGHHSKLHLVLTDHYFHNPQQAEILGLLHQCKDEEARNSVRFIGRLPSCDLPSLYKYALGTIVPTLFEGSCPFPILESLTVNTPAAISRLEVCKEVIDGMEAFSTFDPYSTDEIEQAIQLLWKNRKNTVQKQKAAISGALERNWSDVANEYFELVKKIITRNI